VGQIPVYYSQPATGDYVEESAQPLFPFGYGLSYTQFEYSDLQVEAMSSQQRNVGMREMQSIRRSQSMADTLYKITCTVKNIGPYSGDEVVQLYVRDEVASIAPASKLLKGFRRIQINKGESRQLTFFLTRRDLSVYDAQNGWHVESGNFTVMVGNNSGNIQLSSKITLE
jgi:beta-glucosidase